MSVNQDRLNAIANDYCTLVIDWGFRYEPDRMRAFLRRDLYDFEREPSITGEVYEGFQALVMPADVCDDNMAMDAVMRMHGFGDVLDAWLNQENDEIREDLFNTQISPVWCAAFDIAFENGFLPIAGLKGQAYLCCWYEGYGDADPKIVTKDFFCDELGFKDDDRQMIAALSPREYAILGGFADRLAVVDLGVH